MFFFCGGARYLRFAVLRGGRERAVLRQWRHVDDVVRVFGEPLGEVLQSRRVRAHQTTAVLQIDHRHRRVCNEQRKLQKLTDMSIFDRPSLRGFVSLCALFSNFLNSTQLQLFPENSEPHNQPIGTLAQLYITLRSTASDPVPN